MKKTQSGSACCRLRLSHGDLAVLAQQFKLVPSHVSPLTPLLVSSPGLDRGRGVDDILQFARGELADEEIAGSLRVLGQPDRVVTIRCCDYGVTRMPGPFQLYQSAREHAGFTVLHALSAGQVELQFPFSVADVQAWLLLSMQQVRVNPLEGLRIEGLHYLELITLLAVVDAFKQAYARSLVERHVDSVAAVGLDDIRNVIAEAVLAGDSRWTLSALFRFIEARGRRIGAAPTGIRLRMPRDEDLREALSGLERRSLTRFREASGTDRYEIGPTLSTVATTLFQWETFAGVYDTRAVSVDSGTRRYEERMLAFFSCAATNWVVTTDAASGNLSRDGVFGLRTMTHGELVKEVGGVLDQPGAELPDAFYGCGVDTVAGRDGDGPGERCCPACGASAEGDERFCTGCGAALARRRCGTCDAVIEDGCRFCSDCGAPVEG